MAESEEELKKPLDESERGIRDSVRVIWELMS